MSRLMPQLLGLFLLTCVWAGPASAAIFSDFNAERHEREIGGAPNPNFILSDFDISGIALGGRGATLITPQHYVTAAHLPATEVQFRGSDGVIESFTSNDSITVTTLFEGSDVQSDVRIYRLDRPVSDTITPLPIVTGNPIDLLGREIFSFGQNDQAGTNLVDVVGLATFANDARPTLVAGFDFDTDTNGGTNATRDEIGLEGGDSGQPMLLSINGQLGLIGANFGIDTSNGLTPGNRGNYSSFASFLTIYQDQINAFVGADGYAVGTLGLTPIPEPSSVAVLGLIAGIAGCRSRRRRPRAINGNRQPAG